jgi:hypothetical protein
MLKSSNPGGQDEFIVVNNPSPLPLSLLITGFQHLNSQEEGGSHGYAW